MTDYNVPFVANQDDLHCYEASLNMILGFFKPDEKYSTKELAKITNKVPGKYTWPHAALIWLKERGADIKLIEGFDHKAFVKKGGEYLIEEFGKQVGQNQIDNSDIDQEIQIDKELQNHIDVEHRLPDIEEIKRFLKQGYLVICNVNSRALNDKEGYTGHAVIVKGFDDKSLIIHDPGLPPLENRYVREQDFLSAWAFPNEKAKNITAIRFYS